MIKAAALINLFGLLLFNALFLADITITQDVPATMQAGSEVKVTVTVEKGDLSGFAKLQIDLPEGMTATAIETKGASFTFAEQKAKFIWMALPAQPSFKVTYTLAVNQAASGSLPITGKFSFIEDNERKSRDLPVTAVTIIPSAVAQSATEPEPTAPDPATDTSNDVVFAGGAAPVKATVVENRSGIAPQQGKGNVGATRTITPVTENEMLVEVTVKKGDIRGFGKLQETIPAGFTALEKSSDEAIFTAQDRIVKFVWLNLPAKAELKVTYKLRANGQPEGDYTVNGEFGYLLNDETQKAIVGSTTFPIGPKAMALIAANTTEPVKNVQGGGQVQQPEVRQEPVVAQQQQQQPKQEPIAKAEPKPEPKATDTGRIPAPETGVTYKVQITAAHREVGRAYFEERHRFTGDFSIERHEGWIKYTTGRFGRYAEARDKRQSYISAGHAFPGPFVTAYNNGERITVQEALMISNQKWVQ
jgi:hypothetical protein